MLSQSIEQAAILILFVGSEQRFDALHFARRCGIPPNGRAGYMRGVGCVRRESMDDAVHEAQRLRANHGSQQPDQAEAVQRQATVPFAARA